MNKPDKRAEAEIFDLAKSDTEIKREATIRKVLDAENQTRSNALIELMLDTYKQKIESTVRKELEEKYRSEFDKKFEVEMIKNNYESLHHQRVKLHIQELEDRLKKSIEVKEKEEDRVDVLKREKAVLELHIVRQTNLQVALEEEKKALILAVEHHKLERDRSENDIEGLERRNRFLQKKIEILQGKLEHGIGSSYRSVQAQAVPGDAPMQHYQTYREREKEELRLLLSEVHGTTLEKEERAKTISADGGRTSGFVLQLQDRVKEYRTEIEKLRKQLKQNDLESDRRTSTLASEKNKYALVLEKKAGEMEAIDTRVEVLLNEKRELEANVHKLIDENEDLLGKFQSLQGAVLRKDFDFEKASALYESEKKVLNVLIQEKTKEKEKIEHELSNVESTKNNRIAELENQVNELRAGLAQLRESYQQKLYNEQALKDGYNAEKVQVVLALDEQKKKYEELEQHYNAARVGLDHFKVEFEQLHSSFEEKNKEVHELREMFATEKNQLTTAVKTLAHEKEEAEQRINDLATQKESNTWEIEILKKYVREKTEELEARKHEFNTEKTHVDALAASIKEEKGTWEARLMILEQEKSSATAERDRLMGAIEEVKEERDTERTSAHEKMSALESTLQALREDKSTLKARTQIVEHEKNFLQSEQEKLTKTREVAQNEHAAQIQDINEKVRALQTQVDYKEQEKQSILRESKEKSEALGEVLQSYKEKVNETNAKIQALDARCDKYKKAIQDLEKNKVYLNRACEAAVKENQALKRELTSVGKTAQEALVAVDRGTSNRLKIEKENELLQEKVMQITNLNQNVRDEVQGLKKELQNTQMNLQYTMRKGQEAESKKNYEIKTLHATKYAHEENIKKTNKELELVRAEVVSVKDQRGTLTGEVTKARLEIDELRHNNELFQNEKKLLENNMKSYNRSLEDMQLLLQSEKERSKNLEQERAHLKKCIEISQKAFDVNKKLTDLTDDDSNSGS